ncbi:wall-associated receptor kinase 3-like [Lycium ferocissimum]|uniref:wall-associated receptor kinase 3-like n=1 Tax=Lycium ferocissimum TaxID=112874 RepID=UPI002815C8B0|nr:wall-associated receptor kinase 3-like [Lycium ferocissimum]
MAPHIDVIPAPDDDIRPMEGTVMATLDQELIGRFRKLEPPRFFGTSSEDAYEFILDMHELLHRMGIVETYETSRQGGSSASVYQPSSPFTYYFCGEMGHVARRCPQPRRDYQPSRTPTSSGGRGGVSQRGGAQSGYGGSHGSRGGSQSARWFPECERGISDWAWWSPFYKDVHGDIDRCSFAFVTGERAFKLTPDIYTKLKKEEVIPSVLEWFIGNISCEEAKKNLSYACKSVNSHCYESFTGSGLLSGYRCSCDEGFNGNPYIKGGCKDIDECQTPDHHHCKENSVCNNTYGNYTCTCLDGFHGDGREGCTPNPVHDRIGNEVNKLLAGGAIGTTILLVTGGWLYFALIQRRKMAMKKIKFFKENGGVMLLEQLVRQGKSTTAVRIFTSEELKEATNNYDESRIVGQGGFGIVYKGYLPNNDIVDIAIKKSKKIDGTQTEEFVNEVIVLSQINHRNAVKLLGCCFETEVPFLVYEYIDNGTLYDHLHDKFKILSLQTRLRIATGTAEVLSYLHSAASTSIIHRDVKSTNILLDSTYTAKVSDFGASRLVPLDETTFSTMVRGTLGYLDPEYMQTSQLTDRSDVYSFGVVLAELLTGEKAISFDRSEEERSLANHFLLSIEGNHLLDVLDCHILSDRNTEHIVRGVAMLAKRCLNVKGKDRPTMKEVATELQGLLQIISSNHDSEEYCCQVADEKLTSYRFSNDFIMPDDCDSEELKMLPSK